MGFVPGSNSLLPYSNNADFEWSGRLITYVSLFQIPVVGAAALAADNGEETGNFCRAVRFDRNFVLRKMPKLFYGAFNLDHADLADTLEEAGVSNISDENPFNSTNVMVPTGSETLTNSLTFTFDPTIITFDEVFSPGGSPNDPEDIDISYSNDSNIYDSSKWEGYKVLYLVDMIVADQNSTPFTREQVRTNLNRTTIVPGDFSGGFTWEFTGIQTTTVFLENLFNSYKAQIEQLFNGSSYEQVAVRVIIRKHLSQIGGGVPYDSEGPEEEVTSGEEADAESATAIRAYYDGRSDFNITKLTEIFEGVGGSVQIIEGTSDDFDNGDFDVEIDDLKINWINEFFEL